MKDCPLCPLGEPKKAYIYPIYEYEGEQMIRRDAYVRIGTAMHDAIQKMVEEGHDGPIKDIRMVRQDGKLRIEVI